MTNTTHYVFESAMRRWPRMDDGLRTCFVGTALTEFFGLIARL